MILPTTSFSAPDVEDDPSDDPDFNPYVLDDSDDEADLQDDDKVSCDNTGFSSEIGTKLRDWAFGQAEESCYSRAALSSP